MSDYKMAKQTKAHYTMVPLRYVLTPMLIILITAAIFVVVATLAPKPAKKPIIIKSPLVDVINIERKNITFAVQSQGSLLPRTQTSLISEVSGMITEVSPKFYVGGFFKKGEPLLAIDDITYQVALIQAQSRLDSAKASLVEEQARTKQAEDEWLLSGKALKEAPVLALRIPQQQKAQADLLAAKADYKAAQIKLERTKIVAPYDAMIKTKIVDQGQYVSTGTLLAETFAVDYGEVRLPVKQKDVAFLNLPNINDINSTTSPVELSYQLNGSKHLWTSHLTRYEGVVDSKSRVHYVIAQIDDPYAIKSGTLHNPIHIGTFVNANITGKIVNNVVAIPRGAIYGENSLYLVDSHNKLKIVKVELLRTDNHFFYTLDEFTAKDRVILTKLTSPVEGMTLRVNGDVVEEAKTNTPANDDTVNDNNDAVAVVKQGEK